MKRLHTTIFWASMVSLLLFLSASTVYAVDCSSASIKRVGTNPTYASGGSPYFVQLDCAIDTVWDGVLTLYLSTDLGDSGLATLLTAYSLEKTVWVRTLGTDPGSLISIIYIND